MTYAFKYRIAATVRCNCYRSGRTSKPPVPRNWLDEDGCLLASHKSDETEAKVDTWRKVACEHPDMVYAREYLGSEINLEELVWAICSAQRASFPILRRHLPDLFCLSASSEIAAAALTELEVVRSLGVLGETTYLVDFSTQEALQPDIPLAFGHFASSNEPRLNMNIENGTFFVRGKLLRILFRAKRFRQEPVEPEHRWRDFAVKFVDLDTEKRFRCPFAFRRRDLSCPTEIGIMKKTRRPAEFDPVLTQLEHIFQASVESGNPVMCS